MGISGQTVLPCCWETQGLDWHAKQYPMTAYEWDLTRRGIRIDRFVSRDECATCKLCAHDHTVGWTYKTKVCLKDLARLHLWTPPPGKTEQTPGAIHRLPPLPRMTWDERTYRIYHRPTGLWADVKADSAEEAVKTAGRNHVAIPAGAEWRIEDCWVRQHTSGGGWGKVRR